MLETALPNRAPPPSGWSTDDVGGCPWHLRDVYGTPAALAARTRAEESMCAVIIQSKTKKDEAMQVSEAGRAVTVSAAVGRRVVCLNSRAGQGQAPVRGLYQGDGRVLVDAASPGEAPKAMSVHDFVVMGGLKGTTRVLRSILLETANGAITDGQNLEEYAA